MSGKKLLALNLPWAPSANRIWRNYGGRTILHPKVEAYRQMVGVEVVCQARGVRLPLEGNLAVNLALYPKRRGYDVDNRVKPVLDALQHAGVIRDDNQFRSVAVREMVEEKVSGGMIRVKIFDWSEEWARSYERIMDRVCDPRTLLEELAVAVLRGDDPAALLALRDRVEEEYRQ